MLASLRSFGLAQDMFAREHPFSIRIHLPSSRQGAKLRTEARHPEQKHGNNLPLTLTPCLFEAKYSVSWHGTMKTFESQFTHGFGLDELFHAREHALRNENFARLGFTAQTRRQVGHAANGAVLPTAFKADGADGGIPLGYADAEVEIVAELAPLDPELFHPLAHDQHHAHGSLRGIFDGHGVVEENHHAVAGKVFQRCLIFKDQLAHCGMILV